MLCSITRLAPQCKEPMACSPQPGRTRCTEDKQTSCRCGSSSMCNPSIYSSKVIIPDEFTAFTPEKCKFFSKVCDSYGVLIAIALLVSLCNNSLFY